MPRLWPLPVFLLLAFLPIHAQDKKKPPPKADPRVLLAVPLGVTPGKATRLTLRGSNLDDAKEVRIEGAKGAVKILGKGKAGVPDKNPDKVGDTQVEIELQLDAKTPWDSVALVVVTPVGTTMPHAVLIETKLPLIPEKETNDSFRTAQPIVLPVVIEGTIGRPKDVDVIRFEGKKGQKVQAEMWASRFGSPLDAILTLYDARYQQIAANDDFNREHRDAKLEITLPADGVYYLSLIDAHDAGSNLHVYRLAIK